MAGRSVDLHSKGGAYANDRLDFSRARALTGSTGSRGARRGNGSLEQRPVCTKATPKE